MDDSSYRFDAELVEKVVTKLKHGKAAGLDGLTSEHLQYVYELMKRLLTFVQKC